MAAQKGAVVTENRASAREKAKTENNMRNDLMIRLEQFKERYSVEAAVQGRITKPPVEFIGEEILDLTVSALLQGENILLCGGKATGKNILADNLAWLLQGPSSTFHSMSTPTAAPSSAQIPLWGAEVRLRNGPVAQAAQYGGFCILG